MIEQTLAQQVETFFDGLITQVQNQVSLDLLPSLITGANGLRGDLIVGLQAERDTILAALGDPALATAIAAIDPGSPTAASDQAALLRTALNAVATQTGGAGTDVDFTLSATLSATLGDAQTATDLGLSGLGLGFDASFDLAAEAEYTLDLTFDTADPALILTDGADPELTIALNGDLMAQSNASLGLVDVTVDTITPDGAQDLELLIALDLDPGTIGAAGGQIGSAIVSGGLGTVIAVETQPLGLDILPSITTGLAIGATFDNADMLGILPEATASFSFDDVSVQLDGLTGLFEGVFGQILDALDVFPIAQLIGLLDRKVPILNKFTQIKDFADLIKAWNSVSGGNNEVDAFVDAIVGIADILQVLDGLSDNVLSLGSVALDNDALDGLIDGGTVGFDTLFDAVALPDLGNSLDFLDGLDGIDLPFLTEGPQLLAQILLNQVDQTAVNLITYDIPRLAFEVSDERTFNIFGPLAVSLGGGFYGNVDLDVGYSTEGLFDEEPNPLGGFFIQVDPDEAIASLGLFIEAGLSLDAALIRATVAGGIFAEMGLGISAALTDAAGRSYPAATFPCIFDEISGELGAYLTASLRVGFGFLSFEIKKRLAEVTLLDWSIDLCDSATHSGPQSVEIDSAALAQLSDEAAGIWQLNVGDDAGLRQLDRELDNDGTDDAPAIAEAFTISAPEPDADGQARPGVAVEAFSITQVIAQTGDINLITGDFDAADDSLVVDGFSGISFALTGGAGDDLFETGAGDDTLDGDDGNDILSGGDGDDSINGGDNSDILTGGRGADTIIGGDGIDQVSFEDSAFGVTFTQNADGDFVGSGGDAQGDVISGVEVFIGSREDDSFTGFADLSNRLDGREGDDVLIGGSQDDLLIGGRGADTVTGGDGQDQTSYLLSMAGVTIDLSFGIAVGGDADGDVLTGIEDVQGTFFDDVLVGGAGTLALYGAGGDDYLRGTNTGVTLTGGSGNDTIEAQFRDDDTDGGLLDGGGLINVGSGRDLLSYEFSDIAANVDLVQRTAGDDSIAAGMLFAGLPGDYTADGETMQVSGYTTFEDLLGSAHNDTLRGGVDDNLIDGALGDDTLRGDRGDDTLIGGGGADAMFGGEGTDTADYSRSLNGVNVNVLSGDGTGGDADGDTLAQIQNLIGSRSSDTLTGNNFVNRLNPGSGSGAGQDDISGGGADDVLELRYGELTSGIIVSHIVDFGGVTGGVDVTFDSIEALDIAGTAYADSVTSEGFNNDLLRLDGGNDSVTDGGGRDQIFLGSGNDAVSHSGRDAAGDLPFLHIDGGAGIDRLIDLDLSRAVDPVVFSMLAPTLENPGQRLTLDNLVSIVGMEILDNITTGAGDDILIQPGFVNNNFSTNGGDDFIASGLGFDTVDGGEGPTSEQTDIDTLFLDFSFSTAARVTSTFQQRIVSDNGALFFETSGEFLGINPGIDRVQWQNIERLIVIGTTGNDELNGTADPYVPDGTPGDILAGGAGNDTLNGHSNDDLLTGGIGGDTLIGGPATNLSVDNDTLVGGVAGGDDLIDTLTGGGGADLFVLGDTTGFFYGDASTIAGGVDSAIITDFDAAEDTIQLTGQAADYAVTTTAGTSVITRATGPGTGQDLVVVQGVADFDLNADYVTYVPLALAQLGDTPAARTTPQVQADFANLLGLDAGDTQRLQAALTPDALNILQQNADGQIDDAGLVDGLRIALALPDPVVPDDLVLADDTVLTVSSDDSGTTTSVLNAILADIGDGIGEQLTGVVVAISARGIGNPLASGTFADGFGFDAGLVVSNGEVENLAGRNLVDGSNTRPTISSDVRIEFEELGRLGDSTILRADVTGLDLTSIRVSDAYSLGGSTGNRSGADLDALFFSETLLTSGSLADFDTAPRLDLLDFSVAGIDLDLGDYRLGSDPGVPFVGTLNGFVDNSVATLDVRNHVNGAQTDYLSLGVGGTAEFLLETPIAGTDTPDTPRYLYIAEAGAVEGLFLEAVNDPYAGTVQDDLSTDFGVAGAEGDLGGFELDIFLDDPSRIGDVVDVDLFQVVIAFESLIEFAGADVQDRFTVTVNGVQADLTLRDGTGAVLNNLALGPSGGFHPDLVLNPVGTGPMADQLRADAFTVALTVSAPLSIGRNEIRIEVEDRGDGLLDTAMFIARPQGDVSLADTVAVFRDPTDTTPDGVFNTIAEAVEAAPSGALIRVGADTDLTPTDPDDDPVEVTRDQLRVEGLPDGEYRWDLRDVVVTSYQTSGAEDAPPPTDTAILGIAQSDASVEVRGGGISVLSDTRELTLTGIEFLEFSDQTVLVSDLVDIPGENVTGNERSEVFVMTSNDDTVMAGAGNDSVLAGFGNDIVDGQDGNDTLLGGFGNDLLNGGNGDDSVMGQDGDDTLDGGAGNDTIEGGAGDDRITAQAGDDVIRILGGSDDIDGGEGSDTIVFATDRASVMARLDGAELVIEHIGGSVRATGIESFVFTDGTYTAAGLIESEGGQNAPPVFGAVPSAITVEENQTAVLANLAVSDPDGDPVTLSLSGADAGLFALGATNLAFLSAPDFEAPTDAGGDNIYDLTITADDGNGGSSDISLSVTISDVDDTGDPDMGVRINGDAGDNLINGTPLNDTLSGGDGADSLNGGPGNDLIAGAAGDDRVNGGSGDDLIGGGTGNDLIAGGAGKDTIGSGQGDDTSSGGDGDDIVNGGGGNDLLAGDGGNDTMGASFGTDDLNGGAGNDSMGGGTGRDTLRGASGDDSIGGGEGDDLVNGGGGNDFVAGGGRNDVLNGGAGDDRVNGGDGNDAMSGGDGRDVFIFTTFNAGDTDLILDFEDGIDTFRMTGIVNAPGTGLQGRVDALNIQDALIDGQQGVTMTYNGHVINVLGVASGDLGIDDFVFV